MENHLETAINQIRQQNEAGLNYIYARTYNYVYLRARSILRKENDIQQLMQEVYLKMLDVIEELNADNIYEWLGVCVYTLGCKYYRKKKMREVSLLEIEKGEFKARKGANLEYTVHVMNSSMDELPDLYQATMYAFYYDYMPIRAIAEVMDCSVGAIINRLNYSRRYMIKALQNYQEENNIKTTFSVEAVRLALRKWSVEHCLGMNVAQAVYLEICKNAGVRPTTVEFGEKAFSGVNNTIVPYVVDDISPLEEEFDKYSPKKSTNKKILGIVAGVVLSSAIIVAIAMFVSSNHGEDDKKGNEVQVENSQGDLDENLEQNLESNDVQENDSKPEDTQINDSQEDVQTQGEDSNTTEDDAQQDSQISSEEYLIADSNTKELTREDLAHLSKEELRFARNEIYARHGMIFGVEDLDSYFLEKSWYEPKIPYRQFMDTVNMSMIEEANVVLIATVESER